MYTAYFGFREKPFSATPDPRFFYINPAYQEAYATLLCGIRERKGFIVLTGEVGTGKTTLLHRLMDNIEGTVRPVFFYNTNLSFEELLTFICHELGLPVKRRGRLDKIQALNNFLIDQLKRGGTAALLIDEGQNLTAGVLENLRLLSNLETRSEKLLQIVLVGQPELENLLNQPKLRQLKQRVTLHYRLDRLKEREVSSYIECRLRTVGYEPNNLFARDSLETIARYSKGVPRLINVICDNALQIAYASSTKNVTGDVIREVARDLGLELQIQAASGEPPTANVASAEAGASMKTASSFPSLKALPGLISSLRPTAWRKSARAIRFRFPPRYFNFRFDFSTSVSRASLSLETMKKSLPSLASKTARNLLNYLSSRTTYFRIRVASTNKTLFYNPMRLVPVGVLTCLLVLLLGSAAYVMYALNAKSVAEFQTAAPEASSIPRTQAEDKWLASTISRAHELEETRMVAAEAEEVPEDTIAPHAKSETKIYKVKEGEHLYAILRRQFGIEGIQELRDAVNRVKELNFRKKNWDELFVGEELTFPGQLAALSNSR
jgi:general secretion pathway protein A